jgi:peptidoglycan hydrolase-like protein with peptidoglycan-binding domain
VTLDARKRRVGLIIVGTTVGLVVAFGISALILATTMSADAAPTPAPTGTGKPTATIQRGTLRGTTKETGSLGRQSGPSIKGAGDGVLTELPAVGEELGAGDTLYRSDDRPVIAFEGTLPQWRAFADGMTDGPDVKQLEEQLRNWNYLDEYPTKHFDGATTRAIKAWQTAVGLDRTGRIEMGDIQFVTGRFVVSAQRVAVGDPAGGAPLYETERTGVTITVNLPVGSPLAKVGGAADVVLPNGKRTPGKVERVDATTEDEGKSVIPTTVTLDDPAVLGDLSGGSATVEFVSEERKDVLSVPVLALGARGDGGFEVEVVRRDGSTKTVPVEVGLFAEDRVEVSGKGLAAGDRVAVPEA